MTKLYYVETNGYDMVVADHGNYRAILTDSNAFCVRDNRDRAQEFLNEIEDDSSWETTEATVEELTADEQTKVHAVVEKEL